MSGQTKPFDDDVWELYDTTKDWSQAHDLSKEMPDKLHELHSPWCALGVYKNGQIVYKRGYGMDRSHEV